MVYGVVLWLQDFPCEQNVCHNNYEWHVLRRKVSEWHICALFLNYIINLESAMLDISQVLSMMHCVHTLSPCNTSSHLWPPHWLLSTSSTWSSNAILTRVSPSDGFYACIEWFSLWCIRYLKQHPLSRITILDWCVCALLLYYIQTWNITPGAYSYLSILCP